MPDPNEADAPKTELLDTVKTPDPAADPAKAIEEEGEPFEGNNA